jgi:anti-sigma factor RsiW
VEEFLFGGRTLYVLGDFSTLGGANSALSAREDVSALLASWKQDRADLLRRFDRNSDGQIDLQEWEEARRQAAQTVEQEHRAIRGAPGIHMMHAPQDERLFLISPLSPQKLRQRFLLWSFFHLAVGLAAVGALIKA